MLREALAVALCIALGVATSSAAEPPSPSAEWLARLAEERGPIRRHLEAAFPSPGIDLAAVALGLESHDREHLEAAPGHVAHAQAAPAKRRGVNWGLVVLGVLVAYAALYLAAIMFVDWDY